MNKLIAVHMLILASKVRGVLDEIAPGRAFLATRDEEEFLVPRGAARVATRSDDRLTLVVRAGGLQNEGENHVDTDASDSADDVDQNEGENHVDTDASDSADDAVHTEPAAADTVEDKETVVLENLTVAQLTEMAAAEGVDLGAARKKADIIDILQNVSANGSGDLI